MAVIETRLANLELLIRDPRYRFSRDFCSAAGISPSYLSQLRAGTKTLGNSLARKIEEKLGLVEGMLDEAAPIVVQHNSGTPGSDVMSAAYAMQSMPPHSRAALIRLVLAVVSDTASQQGPRAAPPDTEKATPFEISHDTSAQKSPVQQSGRSRVRSGV